MHTPGHQGYDENTIKLARAYGLDPASVLGGGGGVASRPDEPTVYFGSRQVESSGPRYQQNDPKWKPDGRRKVLTQSDPKWKPTGFRNPVDEDDVKSLSAANAAFYEMEENEVAALQQRLIRAGILDAKTTRLGQYDDDTYEAFSAINERTARFNAVGKKFTPSDVLAMIERNAPPLEGEEAEQRQGRVMLVSNPLALEEQVQQAARTELGRKLRPNEVKKFVSLYQGMEGGTNKRAAAAADRADAGGDTVLQEPISPGSAANQFIESDFAQEAAGQDAYGYLGALRNLIGG